MNKMNYRSIYRSFFPPSEEYERIVPRTVVPTDATHHPFHLKTLSLSLSLAPFSPGSSLIRSRYPSLLPRNFLGERQKTNMEYLLPPVDIFESRVEPSLPLHTYCHNE